MKKIIYKYLIVLTILVSIVVYIVALRIEEESIFIPPVSNNIYSGEGSGIIELKDTYTVSQKETIGEKEPLKYMFKVENDKADLYSLSFLENNKLEKDSTINLKNNKYASDQIYLIFRESYPNISLERMGLDTPEEAYQAKQLAIWEIAARTGEADNYTELSYIDSVKEAMGLKNINEKVFKKAKDLVSFVEGSFTPKYDNINVTPTLVIDNARVDEKTKAIDDDYMIGPYSYTVEAGVLINTEIIITDENGNEVDGKVVDVNGVELENYKELAGKDFYIRMPKAIKNIKLKFKTKSKRIVPTIYEDNNSDYLVDRCEYCDAEKEIKIKID